MIWGIDVGVKHIAAVMLPQEGPPSAHQLDIQHSKGDRRDDKLANLHQQLTAWWPLLLGECPPSCVWVEQPAGRFSNPTLDGAYGIVLASLRLALRETDTPFPTSIFSIVPSEWKKVAIGKGNASKDMILSWAREEGFLHESGDVLDAFGVATAGTLLSRPS